MALFKHVLSTTEGELVAQGVLMWTSLLDDLFCHLSHVHNGIDTDLHA